MTEPEIVVKRATYYVPVQLLGLDERGRQQYVCPGWGCGDTAWFDEDGAGHCPSCEALQQGIMDMLGDDIRALEDLP